MSSDDRLDLASNDAQEDHNGTNDTSADAHNDGDAKKKSTKRIKSRFKGG